MDVNRQSDVVLKLLTFEDFGNGVSRKQRHKKNPPRPTEPFYDNAKRKIKSVMRTGRLKAAGVEQMTENEIAFNLPNKYISQTGRKDYSQILKTDEQMSSYADHNKQIIEAYS